MTVNDIVDYRAAFARLTETKADPAKRAKAMQSLNKSTEAATKKERRAAEQDDPSIAAAQRQQARADKALASAKFKAAVSESTITTPLIAPPRGRRADHFDASGRLIASTGWRGGNELVTLSAGGVVMGRTVIH